MKLIYTEGCICDSLSVDGKETIDMSNDEFKAVLYKLLDREQDTAVLQSLFMDCLRSQGVYSCSDKPCDCCGDFIRTFELEI